MAVQVQVRNLKGITNLVFDVPVKGAFVLTGANGCGKTSLLTTLHRMGARNAFQTGFPGGVTAGIDGFDDTEIQYVVGKKSVVYKYTSARWSATPRSLSKLIATAFKEVLFFKADSSRVEPTQNDLKGVKKQLADNELRKLLNAVFDTDRFNNMYKVQLRGRNLVAHLIDKGTMVGGRKTYYSEKSFSLGELCVMRLALKLLQTKPGGLYIVDEFEMALHPAAQTRLFREIEILAGKNNCTILVSTHSASLIKSVKRSNIIYLENNSGSVVAHRNVYPTYALQYLSLDEDAAPDKLIFVEDVAAKQCVEALWLKYVQSQSSTGAVGLPSVQIAIVGGFKEVLRFLDRSKTFINPMTRRMAVLDQDAEPLCLPPASTSSNARPALNIVQDLYDSQKGDVFFLPWTPEVGLCDLLKGDLARHVSSLRQLTGIASLAINISHVSSHVGLVGRAQRDACKVAVDNISEKIVKEKGCSAERAREILFEYLVEATYSASPTSLVVLCNKLFR
ncbi:MULTISPECIES: ATP-dependent endonuclease [Pseudomonas]|uniref:ATP-dependent nuclease n=1 Tax=Pseudomonas TaxID=286 RepID=UPI000B58E04A|nr:MULTISPECIES: AAA family ATPase [Pseudomonas]OWQ37569.1 ATP-binding protein [Pseudomonas sp. DrBHI1]